MSKIEMLPKGGMEGISVTLDELDLVARLLKRNSLDEVIPLPGVPLEEQKTRLKFCIEDHNGMSNVQYWETPQGSHGWCCKHCGLTLQWG